MANFVQAVLEQMNKQLNRIEGCLERLSDEQIWKKIIPETNSVGNLCIHLAGNEYQHFVSGIGGKPFIRERSLEFNMSGGLTKDEILTKLREVRTESARILNELTEEDLERAVKVWYDPEDWKRMGKDISAPSESFYIRPIQSHLFFVAEHYGYHTGQIVYLTKLLAQDKGHITEFRH